MEEVLNVRLVQSGAHGYFPDSGGKGSLRLCTETASYEGKRPGSGWSGLRIIRWCYRHARQYDPQPIFSLMSSVISVKIHPGISGVNVQMADSEESMDAILNQQSEIGIIGKKPLNQKLNVEPLWEDRLILAVPRGHRMAGRGMVTWTELAGEPFVVREKGSATREVFERYLRDALNWTLSRLHIAVELGSSEAVKEAVIAGLGISMISIHAVERELRSGLLYEVPVEDCRIERSFYLIYRRQLSLMRHHQIFLDFVRSHKIHREQLPA